MFPGRQWKVSEIKRQQCPINPLYPWQQKCLDTPGVREGAKNLLVVAPTSSGKSRIFEELAAQHILRDRNCLIVYVAPYVTIVKEKSLAFEKYFRKSKLGKQCTSVGGKLRIRGFYGNRAIKADKIATTSIATCTIDKASQLLRSRSHVHRFSLLIVDEIHEVGKEFFGPKLESLLTKALYLRDERRTHPIQVVCLTATLQETAMIHNWIGGPNRCVLYDTTKVAHQQQNLRPIPIKESMILLAPGQKAMVFDTNSPGTHQGQHELRFAHAHTNNTFLRHGIQTIVEVIHNAMANPPVLVFCPTRMKCQNLAVALTQFRNSCGSTYQSKSLETVLRVSLARKFQDQSWAKLIQAGIGYHHAQISPQHKTLVEEGFRNRVLDLVFATTTFSTGVNLPANTVIIDGVNVLHNRSYDLYQQLIGRCGRTGHGGCANEANAILLVNNSRDLVPVGNDLVFRFHKSKQLHSYLNSNTPKYALKLQRLVLEAVVDYGATSYSHLRNLFERTLLWQTLPCKGYNQLDNALHGLLKSGFIVVIDPNTCEVNNSHMCFDEKHFAPVLPLGAGTVEAGLELDIAKHLYDTYTNSNLLQLNPMNQFSQAFLALPLKLDTITNPELLRKVFSSHNLFCSVMVCVAPFLTDVALRTILGLGDHKHGSIESDVEQLWHNLSWERNRNANGPNTFNKQKSTESMQGLLHRLILARVVLCHYNHENDPSQRQTMISKFLSPQKSDELLQQCRVNVRAIVALFSNSPLHGPRVLFESILRSFLLKRNLKQARVQQTAMHQNGADIAQRLQPELPQSFTVLQQPSSTPTVTVESSHSDSDASGDETDDSESPEDKVLDQLLCNLDEATLFLRWTESEYFGFQCQFREMPHSLEPQLANYERFPPKQYLRDDYGNPTSISKFDKPFAMCGMQLALHKNGDEPFSIKLSLQPALNWRTAATSNIDMDWKEIVLEYAGCCLLGHTTARITGACNYFGTLNKQWWRAYQSLYVRRHQQLLSSRWEKVKLIFQSSDKVAVASSPRMNLRPLLQHGCTVLCRIQDPVVAHNLLFNLDMPPISGSDSLYSNGNTNVQTLVAFHSPDNLEQLSSIESKTCDESNEGVDPVHILQLMNWLKAKLAKRKLLGHFENVEMAVQKILSDIEFRGVAIDDAILFNTHETLQQHAMTLTLKLSQMLREPKFASIHSALAAVFEHGFETIPNNKSLSKLLKAAASIQNCEVSNLAKELKQLIPYLQSCISLFVTRRKPIHDLPRQLHFSHRFPTTTGRVHTSHPNMQCIPKSVKFVVEDRTSVFAEVAGGNIAPGSLAGSRVFAVGVDGSSRMGTLQEVETSTYMNAILPSGETMNKYWQTKASSNYESAQFAGVYTVTVKFGQSNTVYRYPADKVYRVEATSIGTRTVRISLRDAIVSKVGYVFLSADYRELECRLMCHFFELNLFDQDKDTTNDPFNDMAKILFEKMSVSSEQRKLAKKLFYAATYGASLTTIAKQIGVSVERAGFVMRTFHKRFPALRPGQEAIKTQLSETGFVETICGRRRYLPHGEISNQTQRIESERKAVNTCFQASASDVFKAALVSVQQALDRFNAQQAARNSAQRARVQTGSGKFSGGNSSRVASFRTVKGQLEASGLSMARQQQPASVAVFANQEHATRVLVNQQQQYAVSVTETATAEQQHAASMTETAKQQQAAGVTATAEQQQATGVTASTKYAPTTSQPKTVPQSTSAAELQTVRPDTCLASNAAHPLARIVLQVHDELILEIKEEYVRDVATNVVERCMSEVAGSLGLDVQLPVSLKIGTSLGTLEPFKQAPSQQRQPGNRRKFGATDPNASGFTSARQLDTKRQKRV